MQSSLLWDVFFNIHRIVSKENNNWNNYVAFDKIQICTSKRLPLETLEYFEDIVVQFECVKEINNSTLFIKAIISKIKMLK